MRRWPATRIAASTTSVHGSSDVGSHVDAEVLSAEGRQLLLRPFGCPAGQLFRADLRLHQVDLRHRRPARPADRVGVKRVGRHGASVRAGRAVAYPDKRDAPVEPRRRPDGTLLPRCDSRRMRCYAPCPTRFKKRNTRLTEPELPWFSAVGVVVLGGFAGVASGVTASLLFLDVAPSFIRFTAYALAVVILITALGAALYIVLSRRFPDEMTKAAWGTVGTLVGFAIGVLSASQ
jgi:hypothetical protein